MKEKFNKIEEQLQRLIEQNTARLFASVDKEKILAQRFVEAMQNKMLLKENGDFEAPVCFTIFIHPSFVKDVSTNESLLENSSRQIKEVTNANGIILADIPEITVLPDLKISEGEFKIQALTLAEVLEETKDLGGITDVGQRGIPPRAFLIVSNAIIFPLMEKVINIGRKNENHLAIDDPRVSKKHVQLRVADNEYMIFDFESSGGTYVNGERITHTTLKSGDAISLSGKRLVYGKDAVRKIDVSQEYFSPRATDEHTPSLLRPEDYELDNFDG
ncbi:MAG: FHA domain-containing protein [Chloroflexi bacterium]|nr:FHA domain-containing protein [Chloroflexota bacterium]